MRLQQTHIASWIPARSGYFVLDLAKDETGFPVSLHQRVIIAWAFEAGDARLIPYPVTLAGRRTDNPIILTPGGVFDSAGAFLAATPFCWFSDVQASHRFQNGGCQ